MEEVLESKDFSFPKQEENILELWSEIKAFETQLKRTENLPEYVFYDGPPFATGLPHYGHILAGTIKDIVTRYQSMTGHHVTRRFGWDCHGLPVEHEIDKKLGIQTREDVLKMGIDKYNEECRSIVTRYVEEWEKIITRTGRWIDFRNDYKTMDLKFMESVWWVFAQLFEKGLVYRGFKVMPYSTGCKTPLSNFEANSNYKDVPDPELIVSFPIVDDPDKAAFLAWTTTPWTLPSNLALCVNANFVYVKVRNKYSGKVYVVAESRLSELPTEKPKQVVTNGSSDDLKHSNPKSKGSSGGKTKGEVEFEVVEKILGASLVGRKYEPLFNYFMEFSDAAFRVLSDNYVTDDSGTGIVHCAPAFGEDDYRVCVENQIIDKGEDLIVAVDDDGCFTGRITDFSGRYVKDADKDIIEAIKRKGRLIKSGRFTHSYPFCWRSDTPLIYRAVPSWFVKVENLKEQLLENNKQTYWVPDFVKEKRFHNWLENARDWAISRSRFWGTPLPLWISEDGEEKIVMDSIEKLEKLSGVKVTDLHRHKIDHITIPSSRGPEFGVLRRVDDVFDCWFESGSMPYAYIHYPFENFELFENNFPGHFVAEGLDQTRGWFYTLMVLSTALFGKPAFRNLICNGLVLAEDGKKMSKRLKNYPSPTEVIDEYGADALRLYIINSPVVRAEPLRFKKEGVHGVVKGVFLPWYNAYRFLVQNARRLEVEGVGPFIPIDGVTLQKSSNVLDQWINSATQSLVHFVRQEMDAYRLYTVVPYLVKFLDYLTNTYVRFNRKRLKGRTGEGDCRTALSTLYYVLLTSCKVMAPFTPFFTEVLYQNLRKVSNGSEESIHYCSFPQEEGQRGERIEQSVARMTTIIDLARNIRERHNKPVKTPLREMVVVHPDQEFLDDIAGKLKEYVLEELNIRSLVPCNDPLKYASLRAEPDFSVLGKRLGKSMGVVAKEVKAMSQEDILAFEKAGEVTISNHCLKLTDIKVFRDFKRPENMTAEEIDASGDGDVVVILDLRPDESLFEAGIAREVVNRIQKLRKKAALEPTDMVEVYFESLDEDLSAMQQVLDSQEVYIRDALGSPLLPSSMIQPHTVILCEESFHGVSKFDFVIRLARPTLVFNTNAVLALYSVVAGNTKFAQGLQAYLFSRDHYNLKSEFQLGNSKIKVDCIENQPAVDVVLGKHVLLTVGDYYSSEKTE
ncbi:isoleucine--tRNA ligase, cytoplasmic isoform X1 [Vitis vinifera]|uniref:isoleucine--tRNA ligase, cytoplasmic isoform X1 n=1 Tax=Vitis vinifera TaxID=29760 RepID=UPI00053F4C05|nr:isoleucine--tRNA ligase, cytoplasmic isoform X1 [Vitis vinifera]|eukprot:XP_010650533.1 PREDICTED: isoleucine--tRNA ligase, cytoplasmic isoform X1 [Vitis vinifera]